MIRMIRSRPDRILHPWSIVSAFSDEDEELLQDWGPVCCDKLVRQRLRRTAEEMHLLNYERQPGM